MQLKICDSHLTCKVANKCLNVRERVELVEWNKRWSPPFPYCPVSCQSPWKKTLIEKKLFYQLSTCTALEVQICVNDNNLIYKLYTLDKWIYLYFFFFFHRYNDCRYPQDSSKEWDIFLFIYFILIWFLHNFVKSSFTIFTSFYKLYDQYHHVFNKGLRYLGAL